MRPWKAAEKRTSTEEELCIPNPNSTLCSLLFNAAQSGLGLQKHTKCLLILIGISKPSPYFHQNRIA
jgi:hypothetical protein